MKKERLGPLVMSGDFCFNPCSNGMKKERATEDVYKIFFTSFNPCSNGMKKEQIER